MVIEPTATTTKNSMVFFTHSCSMARAVTITIDLLRPALIFPLLFLKYFPNIEQQPYPTLAVLALSSGQRKSQNIKSRSSFCFKF
jgi:hypothetical protein